VESGLTARLGGLPAVAWRRPLPVARIREMLPRAVTHHRAPQQASTRLFELAGLILLLSFGLAIDAVAAWVLIAMPMTAIVALLVADLEATRAAAAKAAPARPAGRALDPTRG
jgi:hypothetical protein